MNNTRRDFVKQASLVGGSAVAILGGSAIAQPLPQSTDCDDAEISEADFAALTYEAVALDLPKLREGFTAMWPTVALASLTVSKNSDQVRELAFNVCKDGDLFATTIESFAEAKDYFQTLSSIFDIAIARFIHGATRIVEEHDKKGSAQ